MHHGDPNEIAVEERRREGEGEEEGAVGGRDPEAHEGEDGQGDDQGRRSPPHGHGGYRGRFGGADVCREPHGLDPPEPDPHARTRWSCGCFENGWTKSQSQACLRV